MATYEHLVLVCGLHPEVGQGAVEQEGQGSLQAQGVHIIEVITGIFFIITTFVSVGWILKALIPAWKRFVADIMASCL